MTPREQQLEDENFMLREALGMTYKAPVEWRLSPIKQKLLGMISATTLATNERLRTALWAHLEDPPCDKTLNVHVHNLRKKLEPLGIHIRTHKSIGYSMSAEDRQRVKEAFLASA